MSHLQLGLLALTAVALTAPGAHAILVSNHHTYDDKRDREPIGNYHGFTYNAGTIALCNYNRVGFPPSPGNPGCVAYSPSGVISATANDPTNYFISLTTWCATGAPLFNPNGITIEVTDVLGGVSRGTCKSNYGSGAFFANAGTGLPAVAFKAQGAPGSFILDDVTLRSLV